LALEYRWDFWARPDQLPPSRRFLTWLLLGGRGSGKMLALDTPLPTPAGWTTMGEVGVGDTVFDEAGHPCRVTAVYDVETPDVAYSLRFGDKTQIVACAEHQWMTFTHAERKGLLRSPYEYAGRFPDDWPNWRLRTIVGNRNTSEEIIAAALALQEAGESVRSIAKILGACRFAMRRHLQAGYHLAKQPQIREGALGPQIRTTADIAASISYSKRGDTNHCIPNCAPLVLPEADLPVPPYALGAWLGDGHTSGATLTAHEKDIPYMRARFESCGFITRTRKDPQNFGVGGLAAGLRAANVLNNKHVPKMYLRASIGQRIALLQGLMDTDGGVESASNVSFTSTTIDLANAVYELVVSLGMRATRDSRVPVCNGREYKRAYRIKFTPTMQVFCLPRKARRLSFTCGQQLRRCHRMIVSVDPADPVPMRCISVDSPNRMYLCGEAMVPTHNTRSAVEWVHELAESGTVGGGRIAICGRTAKDVREVMVEGESGLLARNRPWFRARYQAGLSRIVWPNGVLGLLYTADEPDSFAGHQHGAYWCLAPDTQIRMGDGTEKPICDVRAHEMVMTRVGPRCVLGAGMTRRNARLFRLTVLGGRIIEATGDHPVWIEGHGFVPLCRVRQGMVACVLDASNGEVADGINTHTPHTTPGLTAQTHLRGRLGRPSFCTVLSGHIPTGLSPMDSTCITSMKTRLTIAWRTWRYFRPANTVGGTTPSAWQKARGMPPPRLRKYCANLRPSAGDALCVAAYVAVTTPVQPRPLANTAPWLASIAPDLADLRVSTVNANAAAPVITLSGGLSAIALNAATQQRHVMPISRAVSIAKPATRFSPAAVPMPNSAHGHAPWPTMATIVSVERLDKRADVYDLAIEGEPEFFANGILVHNCDEMALWRYPQAFTQLKLGLRLGHAPQGVVSTTPRPKKHIRDLIARSSTAVTRATTYDNLHNLAPTFREEILSEFEGTRLGDQELRGLVLEDNPNGIFKREVIEANRVLAAPEFRRIVVGVDPAATSNKKSNNTGIVVAGLGVDAKYYVLEDGTRHDKPHIWGAQAISLYHKYQCDRLIGESNCGGEMVEGIIKILDPSIAYKSVHATRSKRTRAEPIAALYEQGRVKHVGIMDHLEDEMCSFDPLLDSDSPDRMDALVWAIWELHNHTKPSYRGLRFDASPSRDNPLRGV
jgi:phage terminase large subunit-like protein